MKGFFRQSLALGAGVALAACAGAGVWAQNTAGGDSSDAQPHTLQMVQAHAQLDKALDAKKMKQGDPVTAKLQQDVQIPSEQTLPKNTVLEGHVDQVQASEHKGDSTLVITFDKAKLKDGKELPIKATVISVYEPVLMQQQAQGGAPMQGGMPSGPMSGAAQGGGGGERGMAPQPQTSNLPAAGGTQSQQQQQGGVPGVMLKSDLHDPASATFTSRGKNVRIPNGAEMEVALTVIPPGVKLQQ